MSHSKTAPIQKIIEELSEGVANGIPSDWSAYRYMTGQIAAYKNVLEILKQGDDTTDEFDELE